MVIEKCPKCGSSSLEHLCITTIPPINKVRCPICNWEHEEKEPVINIPYGGSINIGDMEVPIKPIEEIDDKAIINYFSQKEWLILEEGLNAIFNQGNIDMDLSDFISLAIKVINLRKKKQKLDKEKKVEYNGFTVNPDDNPEDLYIHWETSSKPKKYNGFTVNPDDLSNYIHCTTVETKPENIKATINEEKQDDEQLVFPCTNCHKNECQGCREYGDYITKKYGTGTSKSPCITKGCDRSTREICCGCSDYFEWFESKKKNKIDVDAAIKGNINPCKICSLSQEEKETCKGCRKLFKYVNDVYSKPNNPEE